MLWQYDQSSGHMSHSGVFVWKGCSGKAEAKDNPDMENRKERGPIPRGMHRIYSPRRSDRTGPYV